MGTEVLNQNAGHSKSPDTLYQECKRALNDLNFHCRFGNANAEHAIACMAALATKATVHFAQAAKNPQSANFAKKVVARADYIATLRGNPRITAFLGADAVNALPLFHEYKPKPRKKSIPKVEAEFVKFLDHTIDVFWRGVVANGLIPPLPQDVRKKLCSPENTENVSLWAQEYWNQLPEKFVITGDSDFRKYLLKIAPVRKGSDPAVAAFMKKVREHLRPLLVHEAARLDEYRQA